MISKVSIGPEFKLRTASEMLLQMPVVVRVTEFDADGAKDFISNFEKALMADQPVIPIEIDSYGGEVYSLLAMIDVIKESKVPVATVVVGKAMSCGALLLSFGAKGMRYAARSSSIMIHDVSSGRSGKVGEIKASAEETNRLNQFVYREMAKNCGKHEEYFLDIVHEKGHNNWYMDAHEAKKHNLVNHIGLPSFSINISTKISFGV